MNNVKNVNKKGCFITFEGADGCGKTTQQGLIEQYLQGKGVEVLKTREPGGAELGLELRKILLHYDGFVSSKCESFLFLADRAQHVDTVILPAIQDGKIVLCDRYTDSTAAYQGYGKGVDLEQISYLNNLATGGKKPDLTIVFDVDTEVAQTRVGTEKDRMESEGLEFHKKVRKGYLEIAQKEPERVKVVNANLSIEEVFKSTKQIIEEFIQAGRNL